MNSGAAPKKRFGERLVERGDISRATLHAALEYQSALREQKLGELLVAHALITRAQLTHALAVQGDRPLGEVLIAMRALSSEQLDDALATQQENRRKRIGEVMLHLGMITRSTLYAALAALGLVASGCSSTGTAGDMVKAYEPASVAAARK
jgi:hypothetical protein